MRSVGSSMRAEQARVGAEGPGQGFAGQEELLSLLRVLVECESPSHSKAGVDACVALVEQVCARIGGRMRRHPRKEFGDLLEVRFGRSRRGEKPVLLLGHLDTVWPVGTLARMPFRLEGGRAWGPGVLDMKAGVAMGLTAVAMLGEEVRPAVLLLVSDEEIGSPCSRATTEKIARGCEAVFVLEPAQGKEGAYKTARKGVGHYMVRVRGVAAHSGVDFASGHSAVLELARLVEEIAGYSDPESGVTVNVGVIGGGTLANVVAAEAWAEVDVRVPRMVDARRLERKFQSLRVRDAGCTLEVKGGLNRPPMERKAGTVRLFRQARTIALGLGLELKEASTGGGSDGNFTAALGIPTLDGMGAVGEGAHAAHESVVVADLAVRTVLLAEMLRRR